MQRCSRYEWFLFDELKYLLKLSGRNFRIKQQYPIRDHRGFNWHWDIYVWLEGKSIYGGYHQLIDVNGRDHDFQKKYSGPGGGYTRDYDKHWEVFNNHGLHKRGWGVAYAKNEECARRGGRVRETALSMMGDLLTLADTFL